MLNYSSHSGKASAAMAAEAFLRKHQMDMFGGEPEMVVTLPAAQVNHVGVLVSNLLVHAALRVLICTIGPNTYATAQDMLNYLSGCREAALERLALSWSCYFQYSQY